jgi:alpha-glucosidase
MKPIRAAHLLDETERGVILDCGDGITCQVSLLRADLARVVFLRHGALLAPRTWSVLTPGETDVPWQGRDRLDEGGWAPGVHSLTHEGDALVLATSALRVTIRLAPLALSWALPDGTVFAADRPSQAYSFGARGIGHAMARQVSDRFHGLGDKTGPVDLRGRRMRVAMRDALGYDAQSGDPLYKHWPFLITQTGDVAYGVFYDNLAEAAFDLGSEHDNYFGLYRSYEASGGDLDYYVMPGPGVVDVTRSFLALTGRPALPPRWTLGFAQTAMAIADSDNAQARMEDFIARTQSEAIPVSAFHFGSGYTSIGPKRYVFTWNRAKYPDPEGLLAKFHAAGMHVVANLKPCLLDDHPRYAEPMGGYVNDAHGQPVLSQFWDGEGAHLDFSNPAAIAWWQLGVTRDVLGTGFDTAWNDNNEYGFAQDDAHASGFGTPIPFDLAKPLQSYLMTRASLEATVAHRPGERPFTVTRAGMPGVQRYAQSWTGDNDSSWHCLAWNIRMAATMSLSGLGNTGHDIGGFSGPVPDAELLIRFTQACAVHPRMIMNSWKPDGVYTSPWLHPEATPAVRAAIRLRYRLMPMLYSLMHRAAADGTPPLLPVFAVFPDDATSYRDAPDLMVGTHLLAAPVVEQGARSRAVYLPAGPECWFEFWSGERLKSGATVILAAPLDRLPLVVASGGMLAMTEARYDRLHDEPSRVLLVFPGPGTGASSCEIVEDDGITADGPVSRVTVAMAWTAEAVTLTADVVGDYPLPYERIAVVLPPGDGRAVVVSGLLEQRVHA